MMKNDKIIIMERNDEKNWQGWVDVGQLYLGSIPKEMLCVVEGKKNQQYDQRQWRSHGQRGKGTSQVLMTVP